MRRSDKTLLLLLCAAMLLSCGCGKEAAPSPIPSVPAARSEVCVEQEPSPSPCLTETNACETVFPMSLREFIERYNAMYGSPYLGDTSSDRWEFHAASSPGLGLASVQNAFAEKRGVWPPMPTLSVYTTEHDEVCEICISFDDHDFQQELYDKYKELCSVLLRMSRPEGTDAEAEALFCALDAMTDENYYRSYHETGDPEHPPITRMLQVGEVGFYCFLDSGNTRICMLPLTADTIEAFENEGTVILPADDFLKE